MDIDKPGVGAGVVPARAVALPSRPYRYSRTPPSNIPDADAVYRLVKDIEALLSDRSLRPVGHGPGGKDVGLVGASVMQLDLEHLEKLPTDGSAGDFDERLDIPLIRGHWTSPLPAVDLVEHVQEFDVYLDPHRDGDGPLVDLLVWHHWLPLDFVAAYVQLAHRYDERWFFREHRLESVPDGFERNASRLARLIAAARELLLPCGWTMAADGLVHEVDMPESHQVEGGWAQVEAALVEAQAEAVTGEYADAMTDVGRALQLAFTAAGHDGPTTGAQLKDARKAGLFSGADSQLGVATEALVNWIVAQRNTRSDSHPSDNPPASADITVAMSATRAVIRYLQAT